VPDVTCFDAAADEFIMGCFDVGDDQPPTAEPGAAAVIPLPNVTEHPEPGGREPDDSNVVCRGDIVVEPPTQALVELPGSLDVGHGDDVDLEFHFESSYAGVMFLLFQASVCSRL
jgi:hypothetical protein